MDAFMQWFATQAPIVQVALVVAIAAIVIAWTR